MHDPQSPAWIRLLALCPEDAEPEDGSAVGAFGRVGVRDEEAGGWVRCRPCHAGMRRSESSHGELGCLVDRARRSANVPRPERPRGVEAGSHARAGDQRDGLGAVVSLPVDAGRADSSELEGATFPHPGLPDGQGSGRAGDGLAGPTPRSLADAPGGLPPAVRPGGGDGRALGGRGDAGCGADRRLLGPMVRASGRPASDRRGPGSADPRGGLVPRGATPIHSICR